MESTLWNRNYFYGSGSDFWKVMVPVPTFEKFRFRFQLHIYVDHKLQIFQIFFGIFAFLYSKMFSKEQLYKFQQIYCIMWMTFFFYEGNQIPVHNFISSSGSGSVINKGSGSDFLTGNGSGFGSVH